MDCWLLWRGHNDSARALYHGGQIHVCRNNRRDNILSMLHISISVTLPQYRGVIWADDKTLGIQCGDCGEAAQRRRELSGLYLYMLNHR